MIGIRVDKGKPRDIVLTFYLVPSSYWCKGARKKKSSRENKWRQENKGSQSGEGAEAKDHMACRAQRHVCLQFRLKLKWKWNTLGFPERAATHLFLICKWVKQAFSFTTPLPLILTVCVCSLPPPKTSLKWRLILCGLPPGNEKTPTPQLYSFHLYLSDRDISP